MGQGRPGQPVRSPSASRTTPAVRTSPAARTTRTVLRRDGAAVSPVVGSVLILVITVLGIAGVLYWGAPMIERIQVQNAQAAMVGEFQELQDSSRELSVPDHSRFPTVVISRGQITMASGSRLMLTADQDASNTGCDFHVTNWADTTTKGSATVLVPNAAGVACRSATLQVYSVSGATLSQVYSAAVTASSTPTTVTPSPAVDFSTGDWLFRLSDGAATPTIYAQAWVMSSDDIVWSTSSGTGARSVTFDTGSIFSQSQGTNFLERAPTIGDSVFGPTYYGLWVRSLAAASYGTITGSGAHQVYLSLIGNYDRVDTTTAYRLRYDVSGGLAQSWCNSLLNRAASLASQSPPGLYTTQGAACASITADGVRSVCFEHVAAVSGSNACTTAPSAAFSLRLLHARIYTSLAV